MGKTMDTAGKGEKPRSTGDARREVRKGDALRNEQRFDEAVKCYDCALELEPQDHRAWYCRGQALSANTRDQEALACFDRALAIDSGYLLAWAGKARTLRSLGKKEEAAVCLENYRRLSGK